MITHFIITELPDTAHLITQVNGVNAVINTPYPMALESTLTWERTGDFTQAAVPLGIMKYKVTDGTIESNVANITLNFLTALGGKLATSLSVEITVDSNNPINIGDTLVTWANALFMKFTSFTAVPGSTSLLGQVVKDSSPVSVEEQIDLIDLGNVYYNPLPQGGGFPYAKMIFRAGNSYGYNMNLDAVYTLTINISSTSVISTTFLTELNIEETMTVDGSTNSYPVVIERHNVSVSGGHANKLAKIQFTIASPFLALNDFNKVILNIDGQEIEKLADEVFELEVPFDSLGNINFTIENIAARNVPDALLGAITVQLILIDNSPIFVGPTDTIIINTNIL